MRGVKPRRGFPLYKVSAFNRLYKLLGVAFCVCVLTQVCPGAEPLPADGMLRNGKSCLVTKDSVDETVTNAVVIITHSDGTTACYASAEEAARDFTLGDTLETTERGRADKEVLRTLYDDVFTAKILNASSGWLVQTYDAATGKVEVRLDESKTEELRPTTDAVGMTVENGTVTVTGVGNAKPILWYGLAVSASVHGPYVIMEDSWVQADANGSVNFHSEAYSKASGFFKVVVSATKTSVEVK